MAERLRLPVLPLRDTVVFPGVAVPISAGRPGTVEAIQEALDGDRLMFAVCQRENVDVAEPEVLYPTGVIVRVAQAQRVRGGLQLLIQGEQRARVLSYDREGTAMLSAIVRPVEEAMSFDQDGALLEALDEEIRERAATLGRLRGVPSESLHQLVDGVADSGAFADIVAFYLDVAPEEKQELLEIHEVETRLRRVLVAVERELLRLEAQQDIQQRVQEELGDKKREMGLREQLKAIQQELGEDEEGSDVDERKERM